MYKQALVDLYGSVDNAPFANIECLNYLTEQEGPHFDRFIRRDFTTRNQTQLVAEEVKVNDEATDMLNQDLPLYPNATRDCSWDCNMRDICLMIDRGEDWQHVLGLEYIEGNTATTTDEDDWKEYLPT